MNALFYLLKKRSKETAELIADLRSKSRECLQASRCFRGSYKGDQAIKRVAQEEQEHHLKQARFLYDQAKLLGKQQRLQILAWAFVRGRAYCQVESSCKKPLKAQDICDQIPQCSHKDLVEGSLTDRVLYWLTRGIVTRRQIAKLDYGTLRQWVILGNTYQGLQRFLDRAARIVTEYNARREKASAELDKLDQQLYDLERTLEAQE